VPILFVVPVGLRIRHADSRRQGDRGRASGPAGHTVIDTENALGYVAIALLPADPHMAEALCIARQSAQSPESVSAGSADGWCCS
jgi:hypothetical protein